LEKFEEKHTIFISNIGLGASSSQDFNYWCAKIDVVNGVAVYETYETKVVTGDLSWVENFLLTAWEWFIYEKILEYIIEHEDFFVTEIVQKGKI